MALLARHRRRPLVAGWYLLVLVLVALVMLVPQGERPADWSDPIPPQHSGYHSLLNAPVCAGEAPVRAVIVVHSDPRHPEVRHAIRDSLPAAELAALGLRRAFMLAEASTSLRDNETTIAQVRGATVSRLVIWDAWLLGWGQLKINIVARDRFILQ